MLFAHSAMAQTPGAWWPVFRCRQVWDWQVASLYMESKFLFRFWLHIQSNGKSGYIANMLLKRWIIMHYIIRFLLTIWLSAFVNSLQSRNSYKVTWDADDSVTGACIHVFFFNVLSIWPPQPIRSISDTWYSPSCILYYGGHDIAHNNLFKHAIAWNRPV